MKIAILHDHFRVLGGAEKLVLTLAKELKCDVITSGVNCQVIKNTEFDDVKIIILKGTPISAFFPPSALQKRFKNCNKHADYDFFIFSGTHSINAAEKHKPNLWYCHTPDRGIYKYGLYREGKKTVYENIIAVKNRITRRRIFPHFFSRIGEYIFVNIPRRIIDFISAYRTRKEKSVIKLIADLSNFIIFSFDFYKYRVTEKSDKEAVNHIQKIIVNSKNIQVKVKNTYTKESDIVYPPIECKNYKYEKNDNFWLSVNRIVPEKRIEMQIEAFKKLPNERLIIVGGYEDNWEHYAHKLFQNLPNNITYIGPVSNSNLISLFSTCKGFITTAYEEDFGMTVVEAMASGKPVIAPNQGGYKESVINEITGKLIDNIDVDQIIEAVKLIGRDPVRYKVKCIARAKEFDTKVFVKKISELIAQQKVRVET